VADAVSGSARAKIEAAGGSVSILEVPSTRQPALGLGADDSAAKDVAEAMVSAAPMVPVVDVDMVVAEPPAGDPADD